MAEPLSSPILPGRSNRPPSPDSSSRTCASCRRGGSSPTPPPSSSVEFDSDRDRPADVHTQAAGTTDPVATFERTRTIAANGLREELAIDAYVQPVDCTLRLHAARDDRSIFDIGDDDDAVDAVEPSPRRRPRSVHAPRTGQRPVAIIDAPGWRLDSDGLVVDVHVEPGETWQTSVNVTVDRDGGPAVDVDEHHRPRCRDIATRSGRRCRRRTRRSVRPDDPRR